MFIENSRHNYSIKRESASLFDAYKNKTLPGIITHKLLLIGIRSILLLFFEYPSE